jgi:hypothetical protein
MVRRLSLILLGLACAAGSVAQDKIPDTPAGHALQAWLDAFNSGDRARMDDFLKSYAPKLTDSAVTSAQFRGQSGGLNLVSITRSERLTVVFRVQEKSQPAILAGKIEVTAVESPTIYNFSLRAVPPGAIPEDITLDAALRKQVIDDIINNLTTFYVYPEGAQRMADGLHEHEKHGDYNSSADGDDFASLLTTHLVELSHDKHLRVFYNPYKLTADLPAPSPDQIIQNRKALARDCGFRKLEILPNNIGYVKFDFFPDPMACGRIAASAIYFLSNTDAVIFDLRDNTGGDPRMVAMMCTYLFDRPTHLNDFYDRKDNTTTEYWTLRYVPGVRIGRKPAYVLTSPRTFSGAEEFAYDLKNLKRATIVGETTAGGSHPISPHRAGDHFIVYVPGARSINPVTNTDWEGTGVTPDVAVKAEDALDTAVKLAAVKIQQNSSGDSNNARAN